MYEDFENGAARDTDPFDFADGPTQLGHGKTQVSRSEFRGGEMEVIVRKPLSVEFLEQLDRLCDDARRIRCILHSLLIEKREVFPDKTTLAENRVIGVLKQVRPRAVRASELVELLDGQMSRATVFRTLEALVKARKVESTRVKDKSCYKPYNIYSLGAESGEK